MIYTALPVGSFFGWDICGKYITKELSKITRVRLIADELDLDYISDESDYRLLKSLLAPDHERDAIKSGSPCHVEFPVLHCIPNAVLRPRQPNLKGKRNVGYTFFEENILPAHVIENGRNYFDLIVTGCSWCEEVLRNHGLDNVRTILQGVDQTMFNPAHSGKEYFRDKFVVFSGGKFELRKGQDIVIRAYKVLQDKY
jgi:glycosyltransferase involved in cell wall biosynthesis